MSYAAQLCNVEPKEVAQTGEESMAKLEMSANTTYYVNQQVRDAHSRMQSTLAGEHRHRIH